MSIHDQLSSIKSIDEYAFADLAKEVQAFQETLSDESEIGISVFGADDVIHVTAIRNAGQMVVFEGVDNQSRVARLIQHYTQVSLQMVAVGKLNAKANRIGF